MTDAILGQDSKILEIDIDTVSQWLNVHFLPKKKYIVDNSGGKTRIFLVSSKEERMDESKSVMSPPLPEDSQSKKKNFVCHICESPRP